jgi:hypothetical protein
MGWLEKLFNNMDSFEETKAEMKQLYYQFGYPRLNFYDFLEEFLKMLEFAKKLKEQEKQMSFDFN